MSFADDSYIHSDTAFRIAQAPFARSLKSLSLAASWLTASAVQTLVESDSLQGLESLDLSSIALDEVAQPESDLPESERRNAWRDGVVAALSSPKLKRLRRLDLGQSELSGERLEALVARWGNVIKGS